jgi:predicted ribosome quality control (RQC) complex YloA/Tae2 family protein
MKIYQYDSVYDECTYTIMVGESAQDNWDVIDASDENDLWFHVNNIPSCHVVLKVIDNKMPHKSVLIYCACLCKEGSKAKKSNSKTNIIYTEIKNVKKDKTVGSVVTKQSRIIKI